MNRLAEYTVASGFRMAWRLATCPTRRWPSSVNATTDGEVRAPSAFGITSAWPPSMVEATTELVVPRSIPTAFGICPAPLAVFAQRQVPARAPSLRELGRFHPGSRAGRAVGVRPLGKARARARYRRVLHRGLAPVGLGIEGDQVALEVRYAHPYGQPQGAQLRVLERVVVSEHAGGQRVRGGPRALRRHAAFEQAPGESLHLRQGLAPHVRHQKGLVLVVSGELGHLH